MGSFSIWHWVVVLLIVLLLFGAKRIPELAKGLGSGIKNFKNAIKEDEADAPKTAEAKPVDATPTPTATATATATATPPSTSTTNTATAHAHEQKPANTEIHKA